MLLMPVAAVLALLIGAGSAGALVFLNVEGLMEAWLQLVAFVALPVSAVILWDICRELWRHTDSKPISG